MLASQGRYALRAQTQALKHLCPHFAWTKVGTHLLNKTWIPYVDNPMPISRPNGPWQIKVTHLNGCLS